MQNSLKDNRVGMLLMLASSMCVCTGQLFWKLSIESRFHFLILGFIFYGMGSIIMIFAYRFGELSVLQPMLSLNYIITVILAVVVLNETLTVYKSGGIFLIIFGVLLIGGGDRKA